MHQTLLYIFLLLAFSSCSNAKSTEKQTHTAIFKETDSVRVVEIINRISEYENYKLNDIAREFIGTPYAAHTLEKSDEENLIINLHQLDCTTFVETCLALQRTLDAEASTFEEYANQLKNIRYRNGKLNGYVSRLHYFTDWIDNNIEKGFVADVTQNYGGIAYQKEINFMSTHPDAYSQLKADTTLIKSIIKAENRISSQSFYFIPKEEIAAIENEIEAGLIVAFTTSIDGLDVVHNGIITKVEGKTHMIHASSDAGKVVITENTLLEYIMQNRIQSGIILLKSIR